MSVTAMSRVHGGDVAASYRVDARRRATRVRQDPSRRATGLLHDRGRRARAGCARPGGARPGRCSPCPTSPVPMLVLEWIDAGGRRRADRGRVRAGRSPRCTPPARRRSAGRIAAPPGAGRCRTSRSATWAEFYAAERLLPLARLARDGRRAAGRGDRRPGPARRSSRSGSTTPPSRRRGCTATCGPATGWSTRRVAAG